MSTNIPVAVAVVLGLVLLLLLKEGPLLGLPLFFLPLLLFLLALDPGQLLLLPLRLLLLAGGLRLQKNKQKVEIGTECRRWSPSASEALTNAEDTVHGGRQPGQDAKITHPRLYHRIRGASVQDIEPSLYESQHTHPEVSPETWLGYYFFCTVNYTESSRRKQNVHHRPTSGEQSGG